MHPRWQQVLVTRLKDAFPNAQFVACTHSPLIVGGLDKAEVERFVVENGKVVKVDFDADMTMGRTDQVLLGDLFELETTLDPTTQGNLREYEDLLGKSNRTPQEESRFQELAKVLRGRIPPSPSGPVKRRAQELLDYLHDAKLELPEDFKEHLARLSRAMGGETV
jgi:predicted ATP-binding protein involved in virulence